MQIVKERPPLGVDEALGVVGKAVIFAFGTKIYNPTGFQIPPELVAHEAVHGHRQGDDVEGWWERYIRDPEFRLAEEIPAHQAEYKALCSKPGTTRKHRRAYLTHVAKRLAAPIYGKLISVDDAKKEIKNHAAR